MGQKDFLQRLHARVHRQLRRVGPADTGMYWGKDAPAGAAGSECSVFVDRDVQLVGDVGQVVAGQVVVHYLLASFPPGVSPTKGGRIAVDGDIYINDRIDGDDGSIRRFVARRATNG